MMLDVQVKNLGTVAILRLQGHFVIGQTEILHDVFRSLPQISSVILDLERVSIVDAHGLGVMLQLRGEAQAKGVSFALMNVSKPLREILEITHLNSVFQITAGAGFFPRLVHPHRAPVAA